VVTGGGSPGTAAAGAAGAAAAENFVSALGDELAADLAERAVVRTFARGQALFHEGQIADRVLILRSGRVKVVATTSNGREVVLAFRGPGELVGEQAALDGEPRSATVYAVERVEALSLTVPGFRAFLAAHPPAALTLLGMLSGRLRDADAKRVEFSAFTTIERVAARLLELAERFGHADGGGIRIELPLSQEELAGATGASIESVGRALQTMRSLKCIETRRREIRILDVEALEALRRAAR
jgi:CRP/FNR family transcriptional regulator, cyclic AMP receptor protein